VLLDFSHVYDLYLNSMDIIWSIFFFKKNSFFRQFFINVLIKLKKIFVISVEIQTISNLKHTRYVLYIYIMAYKCKKNKK
jgi:hypothetical protein